MRRAVLAVLAAAFLLLPLNGEPAEADRSAEVTATVRANPVSVTLVLSPISIRMGFETSAVAIVENAGISAVSDVSVTLHAQPEGLAAADGFIQVIGAIDGNESAEASWDVCGLLPGNYVLLARATATMPGGEIIETESDARLLEVTGKGRKPCGKAHR